MQEPVKYILRILIVVMLNICMIAAVGCVRSHTGPVAGLPPIFRLLCSSHK